MCLFFYFHFVSSDIISVSIEPDEIEVYSKINIKDLNITSIKSSIKTSNSLQFIGKSKDEIKNPLNWHFLEKWEKFTSDSTLRNQFSELESNSSFFSNYTDPIVVFISSLLSVVPIHDAQHNTILISVPFWSHQNIRHKIRNGFKAIGFSDVRIIDSTTSHIMAWLSNNHPHSSFLYYLSPHLYEYCEFEVKKGNRIQLDIKNANFKLIDFESKQDQILNSPDSNNVSLSLEEYMSSEFSQLKRRITSNNYFVTADDYLIQNFEFAKKFTNEGRTGHAMGSIFYYKDIQSNYFEINHPSCSIIQIVSHFDSPLEVQEKILNDNTNITYTIIDGGTIVIPYGKDFELCLLYPKEQNNLTISFETIEKIAPNLREIHEHHPNHTFVKLLFDRSIYTDQVDLVDIFLCSNLSFGNKKLVSTSDEIRIPLNSTLFEVVFSLSDNVKQDLYQVKVNALNNYLSKKKCQKDLFFLKDFYNAIDINYEIKMVSKETEINEEKNYLKSYIDSIDCNNLSKVENFLDNYMNNRTLLKKYKYKTHLEIIRPVMDKFEKAVQNLLDKAIKTPDLEDDYQLIKTEFLKCKEIQQEIHNYDIQELPKHSPNDVLKEINRLNEMIEKSKLSQFWKGFHYVTQNNMRSIVVI